jgi:hypothetical protein
MNITVESHISDAHVENFYRLYAAAFTPVQTRAAARHMLSAEEFAEEMADKRVDKYVVWNDAGEPVAMTTFTADLTAVPWISPQFYAFRYPDESARGALFYMGYSLVDRERAEAGAFPAMIQELVNRVAAVKGVCVFDVCAYNDGRGVGRMWDRLTSRGVGQVEVLDTQTYYAASFAEVTEIGSVL